MSASLPGTWTGTDTPGEIRPGKRGTMQLLRYSWKKDMAHQSLRHVLIESAILKIQESHNGLWIWPNFANDMERYTRKSAEVLWGMAPIPYIG